MHPTMEVETCQPTRLRSTTSLSFPHRGYSSRSLSTAWESSGFQVG